MHKIKVLHITQSFGGVETYLRQIAQNIDTSKFELIIASPKQETLQNFCVQNNIKHYVISMSRGLNPFNDIKSIFAIRTLIKKEKPAFVHLHSSKAGFVGRIGAKFASAKSLFTPHGVSYLSFTGFKRMLFFMLELAGKKFTYKILAISHSEANRLIYEIGISPKDIYVIPNSLNIPDSPEIVPDKLGSLAGEIKIGTIGRLTYQKNPLLFADIANDVLQKFPLAHFYFLGAGMHDHLKEALTERIQQYNIQNNFHTINIGDHTVAINFLRQLDIFILPSVFEGLPYALLEAMLEGVPSIVSKCDGNNDVINNNDNGFSCITKEEYTEVITVLLHDKHLRDSVAKKGRDYVIQKHNIKDNIKLLEDIYAEL